MIRLLVLSAFLVASVFAKGSLVHLPSNDDSKNIDSFEKLIKNGEFCKKYGLERKRGFFPMNFGQMSWWKDFRKCIKAKFKGESCVDELTHNLCIKKKDSHHKKHYRKHHKKHQQKINKYEQNMPFKEYKPNKINKMESHNDEENRGKQQHHKNHHKSRKYLKDE